MLSKLFSSVSFCASWTVHLPEDSARLGRCLRSKGCLFLRSAVAPFYLVEKTVCAYATSSISFQATHLELGTGKHQLQWQLVHLIATAQTSGEFRKERWRFSSLSVEKKSKASLLLRTLVYWLGNRCILFCRLLCTRLLDSSIWHTRV